MGFIDSGVQGLLSGPGCRPLKPIEAINYKFWGFGIRISGGGMFEALVGFACFGE